ncbi:hypothetical protein KI387_010830, partial [Taxus chinensis]
MCVLNMANREGKGLKAFVFAVNLQVPGREPHNAIFYYVTEDPIPIRSLLYHLHHRIAQMEMGTAERVDCVVADDRERVSGEAVSGFKWRKLGRGLSMLKHGHQKPHRKTG